MATPTSLNHLDDIRDESQLPTLPLSLELELTALESFRDQVKQNPFAPAIYQDSLQISYGELEDKATRLAFQIAEHGVHKSQPVVAFLPPSADICIALLAIHMAGATYVPVDPELPTERIKRILSETKPQLILTSGDIPDALGEWQHQCFDIGKLLSKPVWSGKELPQIRADDISHVFFTSGTTGTPKGIVFTHRNLHHYVDSAKTTFGFGPQDRFLAVARIGFSISLFELLLPLTCGASVHILSRPDILDPRKLCHALTDATVIHMGPSLLKKLLPYVHENYPDLSVFENLRHASSGGDMVAPHLLMELKSTFRNADVFVLYGSSEISCMGTYFEPDSTLSGDTYTVGAPFPDVGLIIVDDDGNPVTDGSVGEVYFSGPGLALGYLNQPELNAQKFVGLNGIRYFAIGDLGVRDDSGQLRLLGRKDFQIQIRGNRIEALEIENELRQCPNITDAVVAARKIGHEDKTLIGYLVASEHAPIDLSSVISHLQKQLPDYAIPSLFVRLNRLPTNFNGKLDRHSLPQPTDDNMLVSCDYTAPRDDIENILTEIWRSLFKLESIGIHYNFYEIGGDSLSAVALLTEIQKRFDLELTISQLLNAPTIAGLAELIRKGASQSETECILLRKGSGTPVFFLYGTLFYKELVDSLFVDRSIYAVHLEEEVSLLKNGMKGDEFKLFSSIPLMAQRYLEAIQNVQPQGPYTLCGHSFGGILALETARLLEHKGETVTLVGMLDTWRPGYRFQLTTRERLSRHWTQLRLHGPSYLVKRVSSIFGRARPNVVTPIEEKRVDIREAARRLACSSYTPHHYSGPAVLFRAKEVQAFENTAPSMGWRELITNLATFDVDGAHMTMVQKEKLHQLSRLLDQHLSHKAHNLNDSASDPITR